MLKIFIDEAKAIEIASDDSDFDEMRETMHTEMTTVRTLVKDKFRRKVKAVTAISSLFSTLKSERVSVMKIKTMARDCMLHPGLLSEGPKSVNDLAKHFEEIDEINAEFEVHPCCTPASPSKLK